MRILLPLVHADTVLVKILFSASGILILAVSIALSIRADCGKNPYDCLTFGLMKQTGKQYYVIRWLLDGSMLLLGIFMHGTFGAVTVINLVVLGKLITAAGSTMDRCGSLLNP